MTEQGLREVIIRVPKHIKDEDIYYGYFNTLFNTRRSHTVLYLISGDAMPRDEARYVANILRERYPEKVYVYLAFKAKYPQHQYKIGISSDPYHRVSRVATIEEHTVRCDNRESAADIERKLHRIYKYRGQHAEREYFYLTDVDISEIKACKTEAELAAFADSCIKEIEDAETIELEIFLAVMSATRRHHEAVDKLLLRY